MAEATVADVIAMIPELTISDSATIISHLADAKIIVEGDGIASTDSNFSLLQRYQVAHLMNQGGILSSSDITNESVADVSIQYGGKAKSQSVAVGSNNWEQLYNQHKTRVLGLLDRIL